MRHAISPRLRAPGVFTAGALGALAIGAATRGWGSLVDVAPIPIVGLVVLYAWSGRDTDTGALIRSQLDEHLGYERLRVQALVGRVLSIAVAVGYTIAVATKAELWPWATLLGLMAASFVAGRLRYGEHGSGVGDDDATGHAGRT